MRLHSNMSCNYVVLMEQGHIQVCHISSAHELSDPVRPTRKFTTNAANLFSFAPAASAPPP